LTARRAAPYAQANERSFANARVSLADAAEHR
jgi:hypothetical protein